MLPLNIKLFYHFFITVEPLLTATSLQRPPLCNGHFFGGKSIHWLLFKPLYCGHVLLSPRSLLWDDQLYLFFMHFPIVLNRLLFSINWRAGYGLHSYNNLTLRARSLFLRRSRTWGIIKVSLWEALTEFRSVFSIFLSDINFLRNVCLSTQLA